MARRRYRKEWVDGVYPLDTGAVLEECFHVLRELGASAVLGDVRGQGVQRELVPMVQYALLYGLKSLFGIARMHALPELLFSDEASMRLVGFNAHQVRHGVCQRGAAKRQGPRTTGPVCPEALQNRDKVIVFAQGFYGIFPMAEFALLLGVKLTDVPPGIGTPQEVMAKYRLTAHD